jgi:hypothetical protein
MSLANMQGKLSRTEMKKIMAGVDQAPPCSTTDCFAIVNGVTKSAICTGTAGSCTCPLGSHTCA